MKKFLLACSLALGPVFANLVTDADLGYSITLPPNWVELKPKPLQHYFRDTTRHYKSQLSIVRYTLDKDLYPTPESWTETQFIGYKLSVETSVFPFGTVMFFDSSRTASVSGHWAPAVFSLLYPGDGDPSYCEYLRYVAYGDYGYEIYAIGDSADMVNQVDFYAEIIASTELSTPAFLQTKKAVRLPAWTTASSRIRDALGRTQASLPGYRPSQPSFPLSRKIYPP